MKRFLLYLSLACGSALAQSAPPQNYYPVLGIQGGRFVIGTLPDIGVFRNVMIDTVTGDVWQVVCDKIQGYCNPFLQKVPFTNEANKPQRLPDAVSKSK